MTKFIERKYIPFAISLTVVSIVGLMVGLMTLRARNTEPVKVPGRTAYVLQFSHDGNTLLGLSLINGHPLLCAWNPQDGHERWRWSFPSGESAPFSLALAPDGKHIAAISLNTESRPEKSMLRFWEINSGRLSQTFSWTTDELQHKPNILRKMRSVTPVKAATVATSYVPLSLSFKRDGKLLVCCGNDDKAASTIVMSFDPVTGKTTEPVNRLAGSWEILSVAETIDTVLASNGTRVAVWELGKPTPIWQTAGKMAVAEPDLSVIYVAQDGRLLKFKRNESRVLWSVPLSAASPMQLAGTRLLTTTRTGMVEVRRTGDGHVVQSFEAGKDYKDEKRPLNVDAVAVSPDGALLAAGGHRYEQDHILIWPLH